LGLPFAQLPTNSNPGMQTFNKSERLCNFRYKDLLFKKGDSFFCYPFRVYYLLLQPNLEPVFFPNSPMVFEGNTHTEASPEYLKQQNPSWPHRKLHPNAYFHHPAKCLVAVPKKTFKNATDRNQIKRIVKEAYRKNKSSFYTFLQHREVFCLLGLVYAAKDVLPYQETESKIIVTLQKLETLIGGSGSPEGSK
jgi:ribonuclease P protein component